MDDEGSPPPADRRDLEGTISDTGRDPAPATTVDDLRARVQHLEQSNRDMRQMFAAIDVAIVFLDSDLKIRLYTPAAAELFGLLEHDEGRPFATFHHPLGRASLLDDLARCRDHGQWQEYEAMDVHGRMHLVQIRPDAESSDGGDRHGVVLALTDLSPLAAARRRVSTLSAAVDSSADAILVLDRDRRIIEWNRAAERLYGYSGREMKGEHIEAFVPPDLQAELHETLDAVEGGESEVHLETVRLHRDGTPLEIESTLSPIRDPNGNLIGFSKFDREVGERRRREKALAARERRLHDAYNHSPDMLASVDFETARLVEFNETMRAKLGYSRAEMRNLHFLELYAPEWQAAARVAAQRLREEGEIRDVELVMRCKDGSTFDVGISATVVRDDDGNVVRSRSVLRDISDRKQAERTMAEAMRMREQFLATVSHELRTPMHAIRSAVDLVSSPETGEAARARAIDVLGRQSIQMTRLLDDLLDVARITEGRLEFVRRPCDLRAPIRDAVDAWAEPYAEREVELACSGLEDELPIVGDQARLQQAVSNLLSNALRHSPTGGRVQLAVAVEGRTARLAVTDHGDGIEPERIASIFDLFAPAGRELAHRGALGLGLSVALRIVEAHEGRIEAQSEGRGKGATFRIELPLATGPAAVPEPEVPAGGLRIVIVEDQPDSLEMLTMMLELAGHVVYGAERGREGVQLIKAELPDIALVDIGLPDIDGFEVAEQVRVALGNQVPLVALTGYGQPSDLQRSRAAGFALHLTKPLASDELQLAMREVVAEHRGGAGSE